MANPHSSAFTRAPPKGNDNANTHTGEERENEFLILVFAGPFLKANTTQKKNEAIMR